MSGKTRPSRENAERLTHFLYKRLCGFGPQVAGEECFSCTALDEMRIFRPGSELICEGAVLSEPMLLVDGWAMRQQEMSDGRRQIFSFVLPGDAFGFCARPSGRALYSTFALTEVTVSPARFLAEALYKKGALTGLAWDMLSLEEYATASQVMRLGRQSAYERLIHLLLEFYYRLADVGLTEDYSFAMPFTQEVLSDALGMSVVHTNRTLQQLRRGNLIGTKGNNIRLHDLDLLSRIADFRPHRCMGP